MMAISIPRAPVADLDATLLDDGRLRLLPAAQLASLSLGDRYLWCVERARYGLPTAELVTFLREKIGDRRAIEIGAGAGDLGRLVGIPMTDSAQQVTQEMRRVYAAIGHAVTDPPPDVERIDARAAITKYKPEVVVASWVTQLFQDGDEGTATTPKIGSSIHGVDELALLDAVKVYIHIGNATVHGDKRVLARRHVEVREPWIVSRSLWPEHNVIYIWERS